MSDLIDRQELLKHKGNCYDEEGHLLYAVGTGTILLMPTVDAEPVRHGHWERVAEQPYFRKHYHTLCCSECHSEGYAKWKYCPNCGAKMDGERREDAKTN